ncbi:MAG TPA: CvpA family protein [Dehalococcoidia bacterium]|nr:CvpA family protein [Dehalococcoidia bacterium]
MNWVDLVIILIVVWFTFNGLSTGLVRELIALAGALIGVTLAGHLYPRLADDVKIVYDSQDTDRLVAFLAIFVACVLAAHLIGGTTDQAGNLLKLGSADQALGLIFGFVKACVIVELLLIAFVVFPAAVWAASAIDKSLLAPVFLKGVPWLLNLLPGLFRAKVRVF